MWLFAPIGNGLRLRVVPCTTLALLALHVAIGTWTLPRSDSARSQLPTSKRMAAAAGALSSELRLRTSQNDPAAQRKLQAVRAAAIGARNAALTAADPIEAWGYRRGSTMWRAASALFVHANALHLLINMIFLLVIGAYLEQAWGPLWTLLCYLGAGPLALFLEARTGPPELVLGSSGAVAALLGAYCVLFRRRPLRCAWVWLELRRPQRGNFRIPCPVLAGLWLVQQIVGIVIGRATGDSGIAYVSHLAGFACGATLACLAAVWRPGIALPLEPART